MESIIEGCVGSISKPEFYCQRINSRLVVQYEVMLQNEPKVVLLCNAFVRSVLQTIVIRLC